MRRGGLFEIEVPQAHWVKTFIYQVVNFYLSFGLSGGGQGGLGGGSPGEQGAGQTSIWGREAGAEITKHSSFVFNYV